MKNGKFIEGTLIKGKDLKGEILCKVISEDMIMQGFQYKMGMNEDVKPLATRGSCKAGLHFCLIKDVYWYLGYGSKLALISIPDDDDVYVDDDKFRTHRLDIKKIMPLGEVATWMYLCKNGLDVTAGNNAVRYAVKNRYLEVVEYLHQNGEDITADDNYAVRLAARSGYLDIVKYLYENGVDITVGNNYAVVCAADNGHLEVVKYLHQNGEDITAGNNYAVVCAADNGHLEVVKYLHQNGADVTADDNYAVRCAAKNGHLEIVKYLHENGADITADDNYAVKWAARNGYLEVVKYLQANM